MDEKEAENMIRFILCELKNCGFFVVYKHAIAKITNNKDKLEEYCLAKQSVCEKMSIKQIRQLSEERYRAVMGMKMHWDAPVGYNEKIRWGMLYDATPLKTRLVDKYLAREYVQEKIGEEHLVPLLGTWDSFEQIDFNKLPARFVLKLNNGSGMNMIVKDKKQFDTADAKMKWERWMKINFAYAEYEMQYRDVEQKIMAEEYIEQIDGNLYDYKFHCINGKVYFCQVIGNRDFTNHTAQQAFFDINWNRLPNVLGDYADYDTVLKKPQKWDEMIGIAEKLSKDFWYVRIDLYIVGEKIYFGEFTFSPNRGLYCAMPHNWDMELGSRMTLPEKYCLEIPRR